MLTILIGKRGSGKDTIFERLKNKGFKPVIGATTRPKRDNETDGTDYYFLSKEEFEKQISEKKFLEYSVYDTLVDGKPDKWYYGSPRMKLEVGKDYVAILDVHRAKAFIDHYGVSSCFVVQIDADDPTRKNRAMKQSGFDEAEWSRRLEYDAEMFSVKNTKSIVNFRVDNLRKSETTNAIIKAKKAYESCSKSNCQYIVFGQNLEGEESYVCCDADTYNRMVSLEQKSDNFLQKINETMEKWR